MLKVVGFLFYTIKGMHWGKPLQGKSISTVDVKQASSGSSRPRNRRWLDGDTYLTLHAV